MSSIFEQFAQNINSLFVVQLSALTEKLLVFP